MPYNPRMNTLRTVLLPVLIGLGILALVGLAGSSLVLYREAAGVHPALGWLVIALLGIGAYLLLLQPLIHVLKLPGAIVRPKEAHGRAWERYLVRYARRLAKNPRLGEAFPHAETLRTSTKPEELQPALAAAISELDKAANSVVARYAATVFTSTAVSQSGRLDTLIVVSAQFRMVKEVAEIYYQRPDPRTLLALYANVGGAAFFAGEIQDSELLAILGAPVTAGISGFIPLAGADPLINLLVNSLLDGSANAFLTLRIGVLARRGCGINVSEDRQVEARSASLEATTMLGSVVAQGANRLATATRKLIVKGAVHTPARAAKGLFGKIVGMAERAGNAAYDTTADGLRVLNESLRFWETVAADPDSPEPPSLSSKSG